MGTTEELSKESRKEIEKGLFQPLTVFYYVFLTVFLVFIYYTNSPASAFACSSGVIFVRVIPMKAITKVTIGMV